MIILNGVPIPKGCFSSGEWMGFIPDNIDQQKNTIIYQWQGQSELDKVSMIKLCIDYVAPDAKNTLALWYIENARLDKDYYEDFHDGKPFLPLNMLTGNIVNRMKFDKVVGVEPHSDEGFRNAYQNAVAEYPTMDSLVEVRRRIGLKEKIQIVFPDNGSYNRYQHIVGKRPDLSNYVVIKKERHNGEVKNVELEHGELSEKDKLLIVDDICSKGSTAVETARMLQQKRGKRDGIYLLVAYLEETAYDNPNGILSKDSPIEKTFVCGPNPFDQIYHEKLDIIVYNKYSYD